MNDVVSIITPMYNAENFIEETIKSVQSQTYQAWEMLIVNDASTDNGGELVRELANSDQRISLIKNKVNLGPAVSRNIAIKKAKGRFIAFLDSDDIWLPLKLECQLYFMQKENVVMSYSSYNTINEHGNLTGCFKANKEISYQDFLKTSGIGTLTTIYNAREIGKFYFPEVGHEDYAMKLQILKKTGVAKGLEQVLANYRILEDSLSSNKLIAAKWQWRIYREIEQLSIIRSAYCFLHYFYNGIRKYDRCNPFD